MTATNDDALARRCADAMWATDNASKALGMKIDSIAPGCATISMTVRDDMVNGHDLCHGGMIFSLADSAFAFACNTHNQVAVAAGCSIDFIRPAKRGDTLQAKATMVHQGARNGLYDVTVSNQNGEVVAEFRGRSARLERSLIEEDS